MSQSDSSLSPTTCPSLLKVHILYCTLPPQVQTASIYD